MAITETRAEYNRLLENISNELDISPSKYEQAVSRYKAVGRVLEAGYYGEDNVKLEVYPQGSFRLGTVVRPIREGKESAYDIDLVSELKIAKQNTNPSNVKNMIGNTLKSNATYKRMLEKESERCWTLQYAEEDGIDFHMDVLPAVPEDDLNIRRLISAMVPGELARKSVAITHKNGDNSYKWSPSNPNGYADWFEELMRPTFLAVEKNQRNLIFESNRTVYAKVADVPNQLIKTPLQRAIQILKRHRDNGFTGHKWESEKPISIILTTLAARIYRQEADVISTLENIINTLDQHAGLFDPKFRLHESLSSIGLITREANGKWRIPNPVNPGENFADRWHENDNRRARAFFQWVSWVKSDLVEIVTQYSDINQVVSSLNESVGREVVSKAVSKLDRSTQSKPSLLSRVAGKASRAMARFNVAHRQAPKWGIDLRARVSVRGMATRRGFRPEEFFSDSRPLPKNASLRFEATTNVPRPFKVYWQVVNTGSEAASANGLRGGFYDGIIERGGLARKESTLYTGWHWIECFIVKDGVCVARSEEFVVNIQ